MTLYVTDFNESIQGTATRCREVPGPFMGDDLIFDNPRVGGLSGGARINYIFNEIYTSSVSSIDGISGLTLDEVRNAIRNASGPRPSLFVPEASFEVLARKQIAKLGVPALKCADLVYEELGRLLRRIDRSELRRFPNLSARITEVAADLLRERMQPTQEMIESLIKIEMAYINTNHPDFSRSGAPLGVLAQIVDDRKSSAHVQGQQSHNYSRADNLGISNQRIDSEQANVGRMQRLNIEAGSPLNHEELPMISISSTAKSPNGRLDYTHGQTHSSFSNNQQPNSGFLSYLFRTHPQSPNNISQIVSFCYILFKIILCPFPPSTLCTRQ